MCLMFVYHFERSARKSQEGGTIIRILNNQTGLGSLATHVSISPTSFFGSMGLVM